MARLIPRVLQRALYGHVKAVKLQMDLNFAGFVIQGQTEEIARLKSELRRCHRSSRAETRNGARNG